MKPFETWLKENRDWLEEEWEEDEEDGLGENDFRQWAKIKYEDETLLHDTISKR